MELQYETAMTPITPRCSPPAFKVQMQSYRLKTLL